MPEYAKVVVMGSPITKSNFKMHNQNGRAILPGNSGTYHDRYFHYEENIAVTARAQNPGVTFEESLIAVLRVYFKSEKQHPDTSNITKSIFDGIEKSGLIVNDAQIRRLIIEEYYDRVEPRFELELFAESTFQMSYDIRRHSEKQEPRLYRSTSNRRSSVKRPAAAGFSEENLKQIKANVERKHKTRDERNSAARSEGRAPAQSRAATEDTGAQGTRASGKKAAAAPVMICSICRKAVKEGSCKKADGGRTIICTSCFRKLF